MSDYKHRAGPGADPDGDPEGEDELALLRPPRPRRPQDPRLQSTPYTLDPEL